MTGNMHQADVPRGARVRLTYAEIVELEKLIVAETVAAVLYGDPEEVQRLPARGVSPIAQALGAAERLDPLFMTEEEFADHMANLDETARNAAAYCRYGREYVDLIRLLDGIPYKRNEECEAFERKFGRSAQWPHLPLYPNRPDPETAKAAATDHRVRRNAPKIRTAEYAARARRVPHWVMVAVAIIGAGIVAAGMYREFIAGVP